MSVSDNYTPIRVLGNGSTDEFSASWKVFNSDYLIVEFEDAADPTDITPQVLGSDYTLAFDDSGFVVTFNTAPPNTVYVRIYRRIALTQTDPYRTAKGFQGDTVEESFDKLTSISQDQQDFIDRGFYAPLGSSLATNTILGTINSTNKIVALSTDGPAVLDIDGDELEGLIAIEADISTVAGIASDVTTVAGIDTEVTTVSGIAADVTTVAGISADVTAVAVIDTDVTAVAGIAADVSTVAGIAADVTAAANNIPKANRTATTNPTVNDDSGDGYSEGSLWVNTVSNAVFFCADPALGAAVWTQIGIAATDLISAATSAGLVLKAANGTDVANFGAGNTANSVFYGNLSMNTTNKIVNMADPTSAQDAATKAYVDNEISGISITQDYELISIATPSGAATVDISLPSGYSSFEIEVVNLAPSTDDRGLRAQYSVDGGVNFISSSNDYGWRMQTFGPSGSATSSASMAINTEFTNSAYSSGLGIFGAANSISTGLGNATDEGCSFIMNIVRGGNNQNFAQWAGTARNTGAYPLTFRGEGTLADTTSPINYLRFVLSSGNITATIYVRGRKDS